ncbi:MAG: hypothetical protein AB7O96_06115 [Pseudobdellovibrionaceae bacterium]
MELIKHGDQTLALVYRDENWAPGLNFPTPDDYFVQAGCWQYEKGKKLRSHYHKVYERTTNLTQELTYVKKGRMKVILFDDQQKKVKEFELKTGDFAIMVSGGHGYEILEDGTQVLEVKNGPFVSVEKDKELINDL